MNHGLYRSIRMFSALLFFAAAVQVSAHDYQAGQAGELHIVHPYSLETPPGAHNGVAYLTIQQRGNQADQLLSASTPRAERVQLHQSAEAGGMMTMTHKELPVTIAAGGELALQPGGYHLMLMGLSSPLKRDERIPLTLIFEKAGKVEVELTVEELGGSGHHSH